MMPSILGNKKGDLSLFSSLSAPAVVMVASIARRPATSGTVTTEMCVCQEEGGCLIAITDSPRIPSVRSRQWRQQIIANSQSETPAIASPYFQDSGADGADLGQSSTGNAARQNRRCACVRARRWDLGSAFLLLGFLEAWWSCML